LIHIDSNHFSPLLSLVLAKEVDEAAMMADPLTGMPGHSPKGQVAKPDYERFERDLSLGNPWHWEILERNGYLNGEILKIMYERGIVHCHARLPESVGRLQGTDQTIVHESCSSPPAGP